MGHVTHLLAGWRVGRVQNRHSSTGCLENCVRRESFHVRAVLQ